LPNIYNRKGIYVVIEIAFDLTRCVTFPGGEQILTQFQGLVCTEAPMPVSTTYKTSWVIGKANLIDPYAVRLLPP